MRHETGPQICSFCHAVSAFAVLKKVSYGRNVFSDIFNESSALWIMEFSSLKAALDPCSLINSLAIYFDGVSCCKCLILRILNTDSFKTYQG